MLNSDRIYNDPTSLVVWKRSQLCTQEVSMSTTEENANDTENVAMPFLTSSHCYDQNRSPCPDHDVSTSYNKRTRSSNNIAMVRLNASEKKIDASTVKSTPPHPQFHMKNFSRIEQVTPVLRRENMKLKNCHSHNHFVGQTGRKRLHHRNDGARASFILSKQSLVNLHGFLMTIMYFLCRLETVLAEEEGNMENQGDDEFDDNMDLSENDHDEVIEDEYEWYAILLFSLIFGYMITLFGVVVGYVSFKEDRLLRQYRDDGLVIKADVLSADLIRNAQGMTTNQGVNSKTSLIAEAEYSILVQYITLLTDSYPVRIQKQLKARGSDIIEKNKPLLGLSIEGIKVVDSTLSWDPLMSESSCLETVNAGNASCEPPDVETQGTDTKEGLDKQASMRSYQPPPSPAAEVLAVISYDEDSCGPDNFHRKIYVSIMTDQPLSGFPLASVKRSCGW
eukprot:5848010-Ditylum_brightwellii.AAC.1